jgi:hypothetical protein
MPVLLQDHHTFKGYATESGTGLYAKALAATVGANHFNRVTWGLDPTKKDKDKGELLDATKLHFCIYVRAQPDIAVTQEQQANVHQPLLQLLQLQGY